MNKTTITTFLTEVGQQQILFNTDCSGSSFGERWQRIDFSLQDECKCLVMKFQNNLFGDQRTDFIAFVKNEQTIFSNNNYLMEIDGETILIKNKKLFIKEDTVATLITDAKMTAQREKYESLISNHFLQENLFSSNNSLNEQSYSEKSAAVFDKIQHGDWESDPQSFKNSMNLSRHKEMLTPYLNIELAQMKLFKLNGYNMGFALKKKNGKYSEIVAVHNNEPDVKNVDKELMKAAIKNGGCYLDHFDGYLSSFYDSLGFEEIDRDKFDPQYDQDNSFRNKYGEADIIYRVHKNCK